MTKIISSGRALVTGASSGLGAALCVQLASNQWTVFGASRRGSVPNLQDDQGSLSGIVLDVTDFAAVRSAVDGIQADGFLDLVLANAGMNLPAAIEDLPDEQARAIMEVNFWGVVNTVRAVLPSMRQRRRGTIAIIGSLAGKVAPPGEAIYTASKHAIEGWAEGLQHEVAQFGVKVILFAPGFLQTDLALTNAPINPADSPYGRLSERLLVQWRKHSSSGLPPIAAARQIVSRIEQGRGAWRVPIGSDAIWIPRLRRILGDGLFLPITRRKFGF